MNSSNFDDEIANYVYQHKEKHYRLAFSYVKSKEDALDVLQEAIFKAVISKDTLKNTDHIKTWFYRILVNTALDFLRKHSRVTIVNEETLLLLDQGIFDTYEDLDLNSALDDLPEPYITIIKLHYFEDLKITDIAEILEVNPNTIKTRLYRALDLLKISLK